MSDRAKTFGEVFTPEPTVDEILDVYDEAEWRDPDILWVDPACGDGAFLVNIKNRLMEYHDEKYILENMIAGYDIQMDNIEACIKNLGAEKFNHKIECKDALTVVLMTDDEYDNREQYLNDFQNALFD